MKETLRLGYCGICDKTQIWYRDTKRKGRIIFTPEYAEFSFYLSDGFIYRHAVCQSCIVGLTRKIVDDLVKKIKNHWESEMVGWASDVQFTNMRALELEVYDQDEKKVHEKYKVKKEKDKDGKDDKQEKNK